MFAFNLWAVFSSSVSEILFCGKHLLLHALGRSPICSISLGVISSVLSLPSSCSLFSHLTRAGLCLLTIPSRYKGQATGQCPGFNGSSTQQSQVGLGHRWLGLLLSQIFITIVISLAEVTNCKHCGIRKRIGPVRF